MRTPRHIINEILAKTNLVDLVTESITLTKAGKDLMSRCPFPTHQEKSASFTVSPQKQFYHCFGCGAHGNALQWLTDYKAMPFPEAVAYLAKRAGIQLPDDKSDNAAYQRNRRLQEVLEAAADAFAATGARRQEMRDFATSRAVSDRSIAQFKLGFAPRWNHIGKAVSQILGRSVPDDELIEVGLAKRDDKGAVHDFFRNRVIFPIRDRSGAVVGFAGREDNNKVKYLNSPETPLFSKSRILFGLDRARASIRDQSRAIVVEGYMDVIQAHQASVENVVGTMGTALTQSNAQELLKMVGVPGELIFCFDGDAAGQMAAERAMREVIPLVRDGQTVRFAFLPDELDPDDYIRAITRDGGAPGQAFLDICTRGTPLSRFLIEIAKRAAGDNLGTAEGRVLAHKKACEMLDRFSPDAAAYAAVIRRSAEEELGVSLPPTRAVAPPAPSAPRRPSPTMPDVMRIEERMLMVAVFQPQVSQHLSSRARADFREAVANRVASQEIEALVEIEHAVRAGGIESMSDLVEAFKDSHLATVVTGAAVNADRFYALRDPDAIESEFIFATEKLSELLRQQVMLTYLEQKGEQPLDADEENALREALKSRRAKVAP